MTLLGVTPNQEKKIASPLPSGFQELANVNLLMFKKKSMSNLTHFQDDNLELVVNTETGECFASQRAISRMVDVSASTISRWAGVAQISYRTVEIITPGGLQGVALFDEDAIYKAFLKYKPELLVKCAQLGLRKYLHTLAGFKYKETPKEINDQTQSKALKAAKEVKEITDLLKDNPRLAQYLIDHAMSECLEKDLPSLPGYNQPKLRGVVEIAQEMGLPVNLNNRSALGRYVKAHIPELSQYETRLVNGTMRQVNCYPDIEKVRTTISHFFSFGYTTEFYQYDFMTYPDDLS